MPSCANNKNKNFGLPLQVLRYLRNLPTLFDGLERVVIFGSRANGTHHDGSDIDLALYGSNLDWHKIIEIQDYLEGLPTPYLWDVVHYDTLNHTGLKAHIDKVGKTIVK